MASAVSIASPRTPNDCAIDESFSFRPADPRASTPPLPVRVLRGGEEAIASGHDLLASAMACRLATPGHMYSSDAQQARDVEKKSQILLGLLHETREVWERVLSEQMSLDAGTDAVYTIFQVAFRSYLAMYPGSPDIRVLGMADIDIDSVVGRQGVEHLRAYTAGFIDDGNPITEELQLPGTYRELIAQYAASLYTFR